MTETTPCARCGRDVRNRSLKEVVHEEGRERIRQLVCPTCLDQLMNNSGRVRGVVGTDKAAAAHIDPGPGTAERQSMGERN
jgi:hypothetical protein